MTEVHVLNGDSLAEKFPFTGELIICREALIEGPLTAATLPEFWEKRADYIAGTYHEERSKYFEIVRLEIERLLHLDSNVPVNLWFENDLFCQTNMWFIVHLIRRHAVANPLYRVAPPSAAKNWAGFGSLDSAGLMSCFARRREFTDADLGRGSDLWMAYSNADLDALRALARQRSDVFPQLAEVIRAHIERFGSEFDDRPKKRLREILASGPGQFEMVFAAFSQTEGIYGFGDAQVRRLISELDR